MKKIIISNLLFLLIFTVLFSQETIDVLIKGIDDGIKNSKQQDYLEAVMNAKLQAIERSGVEIKSFTQVVNFKLKYDMIESKAVALLLPGFQIMDLGYQSDGTYQVVLSGKVKSGKNENPLSEREKTFKDYISKGHKLLNDGYPEESLNFSNMALDIPGYNNDADAFFLQKIDWAAVYLSIMHPPHR